MPLTNFPNGISIPDSVTINRDSFILNDTVWDDVRETLSGKNLTSVAGKADFHRRQR